MTETPSASSIINRSKAAHDDVHAYALEQLSALEILIGKAKARIEAKKAAATIAVGDYISAVDETLRAARDIETSVLDLMAKIPGPVARLGHEDEV